MKFTILTVLFFVFYFSSCTQQSKSISLDCYPNSQRPAQAITYEEMAAMMEAYDKGAKKELDKYMKQISDGKDSVSTDYNWYRLDDLKQYIAYIERISKEKNIKVTGFRIYPTSYPNKYGVKDLQGRQTLIFTPTTKIGDREDVAFEPLYSEIGEPSEITKFLEQARAKRIDTISGLPSPLITKVGLKSSSANRTRVTPPY